MMETCVCGQHLPERPFNPFRHRARLLWHHWITVPLFGLFVFPVRLTLLFLSLAAAFLVSMAMHICGRVRHPLKSWQSFVTDKILVRVGRAGAFVGGFAWISTVGRRADVSDAPILIAAPHTSLVDTVVFFSTSPMPAPVVKAQGNPFYKIMLQAAESLTVHRTDRRLRAQAAEELASRARSHGCYRQLLTFPEGTCTNGQALIGFRAGSFAPGVPVQPLIVRHRDPLQLQCWAVDGPGMFSMIFRCGARVYNDLQLEFLPVYRPSPEEKADPQLFANNVRDLMARHANLPVSDRSYTDVLLFKAARKRGFPELGFRLGGFRRLLRRLLPEPAELTLPELLARLEPGPPSLRCPHEIAAAAGGDAGLAGAALTSEMRLVFDLFDGSSCGRIDTRQIYIAAALLLWPKKAPEILAQAMIRVASSYSPRGLVDSVAMETVLGGIVGVKAELRLAVMQQAPVIESGFGDPELCQRHIMQNRQVGKLLSLITDASGVIF